MTKAERIRRLLAKGGKTTSQIGKIVGVSTTYVRSVRNRVRNKEIYGTIKYPNEASRASGADYRRHRYQTNPEFRAKCRASSSRWYLKKKKAAKRGAKVQHAPR